MANKLFTGMALALLAVSLVSFEVPKGWYKAGSDPEKYDMGIEFGSGRNSKNAATIQSVYGHIHGFGTLMQSVSADRYRGKRIRLSGYIRSSDVRKWAGFWLSVDRKNQKEPLYFDDMHDRAVSGTTNWKKCEIVLDVPNAASSIAFGAFLAGTGKIWFDDMNIEVVSRDVATTGDNRKVLNDKPQNLDFED